MCGKSEPQRMRSSPTRSSIASIVRSSGSATYHTLRRMYVLGRSRSGAGARAERTSCFSSSRSIRCAAHPQPASTHTSLRFGTRSNTPSSTIEATVGMIWPGAPRANANSRPAPDRSQGS